MYCGLSESQFPCAISHHPHSDLMFKDFPYDVAPKYNTLSDAQPQMAPFPTMEEQAAEGGLLKMACVPQCGR